MARDEGSVCLICAPDVISWSGVGLVVVEVVPTTRNVECAGWSRPDDPMPISFT